MNQPVPAIDESVPADEQPRALGGSGASAEGEAGSEASALPALPTLSFELISSDKELTEGLAKLTSAPLVGVDVETTGFHADSDRLLLLQLGDGQGLNLVLDMTRIPDWKPITQFLRRREHLFLAHNAKFDFGWLATKLSDEAIMPRLYDTMVAEQLLNGGAEHGGNSLAAVSKRYLGIDMDKATRASFIGSTDPHPAWTNEQLEYAALDVDVLPKIMLKQATKLRSRKLEEVAQLEFQLVKVISRMERRGVKIDRAAWERAIDEAKKRAAELEDELRKLSGSNSFNPGSPKQVKEALAAVGIHLNSTSRDSLKRVKHPLALAMLEWRKVSRLRDYYGDKWLARLDAEDRIHAQFKQLGASTGRFSSSDPNLQQIPRGDKLRSAFIAGPGRVMVTADYSQIEIRILAELSGDKNMIKLFEEGADIHQATASQMFRLPLDEVTPQRRQMAKSVNFGLIYGAGPDNLRGQLADQDPPVLVSVEEAKKLIALYFAAFPSAKRWLDQVSGSSYKAIDEGIDVVTRTLSGRQRVFKVSPALTPYDRGHIARQSRNTPIQGGSADVTKYAMVLLDQAFQEHPEWDAWLLMTVHDEIVCEGKAEYADQIRDAVVQAMEDGARRWMKRCPVKVDVSVGTAWSK